MYVFLAFRSVYFPVSEFDEVERDCFKSHVRVPIPYLPSHIICKANCVAINTLYLRAANLHQHLSVFFDAPETKTYCEDLLALYTATQEYVEGCFTLETSVGSVIDYATNYILQMLVAAGFTLFKLLNSFFAKFIDLENGKRLFTKTIMTIRTISVVSNDLPSRLGEVLAQMWRDGGAGSKISSPEDGGLDNSLQLKTKARMSMSLIYDSLWRWREDFLEKGRGNLDGMWPLSDLSI